MDKIDLEIYLSRVRKFFADNPEDLDEVKGRASSEEFFDAVHAAALENFNNGQDPTITPNQLEEIVSRFHKQTLGNTKGFSIFLN